jgi:TATA-box binding protein (TBP) (component of TFIID and TFIIIB)
MLNILKPADRPECPGGRTVNVAAQFTLGLKKLNMKALVLGKDLGLGQNQKKFVASLVRIRNYPPHWWSESETHPNPQDVTALVYHTANVVLTGASNEFMARTAAWLLVHMLRGADLPVRMINFQIENIVAQFRLGFQVNLVDFARDYGAMVDYDPSVFPAAIYRGELESDREQKFTVLVNYTGSLVITGSRDRADSLRHYVNLYDMLLKYKVDAYLGSQTQDSTFPHQDSERVRRALQFLTSTFKDAEELHAVDKIMGLGLDLGEIPKKVSGLDSSFIIRLPIQQTSVPEQQVVQPQIEMESRKRNSIVVYSGSNAQFSPNPNLKRRRIATPS